MSPVLLGSGCAELLSLTPHRRIGARPIRLALRSSPIKRDRRGSAQQRTPQAQVKVKANLPIDLGSHRWPDNAKKTAPTITAR